VDREEARDGSERRLRPKEEATAFEGVGDRPAEDGEREQRDEVAQAEQPDRERGMRQAVHLERDRNERDLAPHERDHLAEPEVPEVPGGLERRKVDRDARERAGGTGSFGLRREVLRKMSAFGIAHGARA